MEGANTRPTRPANQARPGQEVPAWVVRPVGSTVSLKTDYSLFPTSLALQYVAGGALATLFGAGTGVSCREALAFRLRGKNGQYPGLARTPPWRRGIEGSRKRAQSSKWLRQWSLHCSFPKTHSLHRKQRSAKPCMLLHFFLYQSYICFQSSPQELPLSYWLFSSFLGKQHLSRSKPGLNSTSEVCLYRLIMSHRTERPNGSLSLATRNRSLDRRSLLGIMNRTRSNKARWYSGWPFGL
jgi:hypothetical protein